MTTDATPTEEDLLDDIGHDFAILEIVQQQIAFGTWAIGLVAGHRFEALLFPGHAANPAFELGDSRISKLWVQRLADRVAVANFDRGWDVRPAGEVAAAIVDFLAEGLATRVFGTRAV